MMRSGLNALLVLLIAVPAQAQIITGSAIVLDGDTIDMTGTRVRLIGIDAPEARQSCLRSGAQWACGAEATASLAAMIAGQNVTCKTQGTDSYGRTLAQCQTRIFDIGQEMVRRGLALPLDYAPAAYHEAGAIAKRLNYGLWAGTFVTPAQWRAANPETPRQARTPANAPRRTAAAQPATPTHRQYTDQHGCAIKGKRGRRGEWIYHLPGQTYYANTRPEELFCTEREAMAAGYRRSKV